jgi:hypothetical protein
VRGTTDINNGCVRILPSRHCAELPAHGAPRGARRESEPRVAPGGPFSCETRQGRGEASNGLRPRMIRQPVHVPPRRRGRATNSFRSGGVSRHSSGGRFRVPLAGLRAEMATVDGLSLRIAHRSSR